LPLPVAPPDTSTIPAATHLSEVASTPSMPVTVSLAKSSPVPPPTQVDTPSSSSNQGGGVSGSLPKEVSECFRMLVKLPHQGVSVMALEAGYHVDIAPVQAQRENFFPMSNLAMNELAKGLRAPRHDDTMEGWSVFLEDFQVYVGRLTATHPVPDALLYQLLEQALGTNGKKTLKLEKSMDPALTYLKSLAILSRKFGRGRDEGYRQAWLEVSLPPPQAE